MIKYKRKIILESIRNIYDTFHSNLVYFFGRNIFLSSKEVGRQFDDACPFSDFFLPDLKGIVIGMQLIFLETGASNFISIRELLVPDHLTSKFMNVILRSTFS